MKLLLVSTDGKILDSTDDFTREEFDAISPLGAHALIGDLSAGNAT